MTFYNVISGILFFATFQAFLQDLGTLRIGYTATLMFIMCNEAVLTSEVLEGDPKIAYTLKMKFLDLGTFFLLAASLLILKPAIIDRVDMSDVTWFPREPWVVLLLLACYWLMTMYWNRLAKQHDITTWQPRWLRFANLMWVVMLVLSAVAYGVRHYGLPLPEQLPGAISAVVVFVFAVGKIWGRKTPPTPVPVDFCRYQPATPAVAEMPRG